jgi:hypothetical protein
MAARNDEPTRKERGGFPVAPCSGNVRMRTAAEGNGERGESGRNGTIE